MVHEVLLLNGNWEYLVSMFWHGLYQLCGWRRPNGGMVAIVAISYQYHHKSNITWIIWFESTGLFFSWLLLDLLRDFDCNGDVCANDKNRNRYREFQFLYERLKGLKVNSKSHWILIQIVHFSILIVCGVKYINGGRLSHVAPCRLFFFMETTFGLIKTIDLWMYSYFSTHFWLANFPWPITFIVIPFFTGDKSYTSIGFISSRHFLESHIFNAFFHLPVTNKTIISLYFVLNKNDTSTSRNQPYPVQRLCHPMPFITKHMFMKEFVFPLTLCAINLARC